MPRREVGLREGMVGHWPEITQNADVVFYAIRTRKNRRHAFKFTERKTLMEQEKCIIGTNDSKSKKISEVVHHHQI